MNVRPGDILYNWPAGACEEAIRFESSDQLGNDSYDVIIVGAGVTGCALAYKLSLLNVSVLVLDKRHDVGAGTSKANSAIIHTGFDEKPGTLSSELVTSASRTWPELAQRLKIPLLPIGGLLLATDDEQERQLDDIQTRAFANGVDDVQRLSMDEVQAIEPAVTPQVRGGVLVPRESLGDPFTTSVAYAEVALANGVDFVLGVSIREVESIPSGLKRLKSPEGHCFAGRVIVNMAGLGSRALADAYGGESFDIHPRRGQFLLFDACSRDAIQHILLPVPTLKTKGVLVSPTIYGNLLAGPTAEDLPLDCPEATDTTIEGLKAVLTGGCQLYPELAKQPVISVYAGARCACDQGNYLVRYNDGLPGIVTVTGVRSTGLTGSIALAEHVLHGIELKCGLALTPKAGAVDQRDSSCWPGWWRPPYDDPSRVAARSSYGRITCFCESISEGEIIDALDSPLKPRTLDGVKRRTRAMMGRCQGFDCNPSVCEILSKHCGIPLEMLTKNGPGSKILSPAAQLASEYHE
jgi:glycerol-3-phosphate dehydrogenase